MQQSIHTISTERTSRERVAGLVLAGVIPALFVWAMIAGLIPQVVPPVVRDIIVTIIPGKQVVDSAPPNPVVNHHIDTTDLMPPTISINNDSDRTITLPFAGGGNQMAGNPDQSLRSIASTHTTPPYPPVEARLGHAGTVTLRLAISADGIVTGATVETSSGSDVLDQAAIDWVKAHWRYQPATRNGVSVATTAEAAVKFDLRNAMR